MLESGIFGFKRTPKRNAASIITGKPVVAAAA
jgi:hypothetical protein